MSRLSLTVTRMGWMLVVLLVLWAPRVGAQTNPCTVATTSLSTSPSTIAAELPDHTTTVLGSTTPLVASYELRYYAEGAPSPFQTLPLAKTAFTPVAGTTPVCYTATPASWPLAVNTRYRAVLVAKGSSGVPDSAPSAESNPFGQPGAPRTGALRVP